ncbi:MAG: ABC transporter ATP-binding protein [Candidatus Paceibacterota bacterium]|jgi:ABC-type multidrug transport system fused ATPase/permease subunit
MVERFERNMDNMFSGITTLYEMALRIDDTYQFFNLKPSFPDGKIKLKTFKKPPKIVCDNISFKYPNTNKLILKNLNLEIKPGEKIAIVGHNGAGKTTLVKLLLRFYQVNNGNIFINNDNVDDLKIDTYYRNVGILSQDFGEYGALNAKDNILLGDIAKGGHLKEIKDAAKKADAHKFISEYPKKYDQLLSESYNGGIRPSTGQWQKIAISRLFYRNPWLVIFDEPTASIDAEAEYKIFNNIYKFFKNKTVVIISHRFSTVRNADRIIVIDKGNIAEQGTHDQLLKLDGKYAKAFKLQAEGYYEKGKPPPLKQ